MKVNLSKTKIEKRQLSLEKKSKISSISNEIRSLINIKAFDDFSKFANNFETNKKMLVSDNM